MHFGANFLILSATLLVASVQGQQSCAILDISYVIVMDSSSTVSDEEWLQQKTFVKNFVAQTDLGSTSRVKVAVVNYGSDSVIAANCDSASTSSLAAFNSFMDSLPKQNGGTGINNAMDDALQALANNGCGRSGESKVMLFLTDGTENIVFDDNVKLATEANVREQTDARLFVAIGNAVDVAALSRITGNSNHVRSQNTFAELEAIDNSVLWPELVTQFCDVGGAWTTWGGYGACSVSCGGVGVQTRSRECRNPINLELRTDCAGGSTESQSCNNGVCPGTDGVWSLWTTWSTCTATCAGGTRVRERTCTGHSGTGLGCTTVSGTVLTTGNEVASEACNTQACPGTNGVWTLWTTWSTCTVTCGGGSRTRERTCTGHSGTGLGCTNLLGAVVTSGNEVDAEACNTQTCTGVWTLWTTWSTCSVTCGSGVRTRQRTCTGNAPCLNTLGVFVTSGNEVDSEACNTQVCIASNGVWTNWTPWTACSVSCGGGTRTQQRTCTGHAGSGAPCQTLTNTLVTSGNEVVSETCNPQTCAICPVKKACKCVNQVPMFTTDNHPNVDLTYFPGITPVMLDETVVGYTDQWSVMNVYQLCEDARCDVATLKVSADQLTYTRDNVTAIDTSLTSARDQLRDIINCNRNELIEASLWHLYDYLCDRSMAVAQVKQDLTMKKELFDGEMARCQNRGYLRGKIEDVAGFIKF